MSNEMKLNNATIREILGKETRMDWTFLPGEMTAEQVAELIGGKVWEKGDIVRVYVGNYRAEERGEAAVKCLFKKYSVWYDKSADGSRWCVNVKVNGHVTEWQDHNNRIEIFELIWGMALKSGMLELEPETDPDPTPAPSCDGEGETDAPAVCDDAPAAIEAETQADASPEGGAPAPEADDDEGMRDAYALIVALAENLAKGGKGVQTDADENLVATALNGRVWKNERRGFVRVYFPVGDGEYSFLSRGVGGGKTEWRVNSDNLAAAEKTKATLIALASKIVAAQTPAEAPAPVETPSSPAPVVETTVPAPAPYFVQLTEAVLKNLKFWKKLATARLVVRREMLAAGFVDHGFKGNVKYKFRTYTLAPGIIPGLSSAAVAEHGFSGVVSWDAGKDDFDVLKAFFEAVKNAPMPEGAETETAAEARAAEPTGGDVQTPKPHFPLPDFIVPGVFDVADFVEYLRAATDDPKPADFDAVIQEIQTTGCRMPADKIETFLRKTVGGRQVFQGHLDQLVWKKYRRFYPLPDDFDLDLASAEKMARIAAAETGEWVSPWSFMNLDLAWRWAKAVRYGVAKPSFRYEIEKV
jgi:hypothetical protein